MPESESEQFGLTGSVFRTGATLCPIDDESLGPDAWYDRDVSGDLDRLAEAGCGLVRLQVSWRMLEPQVGTYDAGGLQRLAELVSDAGARGLGAMVCLFADDRHTELSSVPWGARRDPRTDAYLIQREIELVTRVVSTLHGHDPLVAWQLGNEAFLAGFEDAEALSAWAATLRGAIREHDPSRPIGLGADVETLYRTTGVDARATVASFDFSVAHLTASYEAYAGHGLRMSADTTYLEPFLIRCAGTARPVLLDEVGPQSQRYSMAEEAQALRVSLWSAACNGAQGALVSRVRDLETEPRRPYFIDEYEAVVGVLDVSGRAKPAYDALRDAAHGLAALDLRAYERVPERAAVLLPAERFDALPSLSGLRAPRACLQAFVAAKRAHLPVTVVREGEELDDFRLVILPSTRALEEATVASVQKFVQRGGTVVLSYGGGEITPRLCDVLGIGFVGDGGPRRTLSCRVAHDRLLGSLASFDCEAQIASYALVTPTTATVVATDGTGNPLLTVNQSGQGRAVFVSVPIEFAIDRADASAAPEPILSLVRELYGSAARTAGCASQVECDAPDVEVTIFSGEYDDVVVLVNHSDRKVVAGLSTGHPVAAVGDIRGGTSTEVGGVEFAVPLGPWDVAALRLSYA